MRKRLFPVLFLIAALLVCAPLALADGFTADVPAKIGIYQPEPLSFQFPEAGALTFAVSDEYGAQSTPFVEYPVEAGAVQLLYDATRAIGTDLLVREDGTYLAREPLAEGKYNWTATFVGASGAQSTQSGAFTAGKPVAAIQYALPSDDVLYKRGGESWFIDVKAAAKGGKATVEIWQGEQLVHDFTQKVSTYKPFTIAWKNVKLPAGLYTVRVYSDKAPAYVSSFPLKITEDAPPTYAIGVTDPALYLPQTLEDKDVWAAMMQPICVMDAAYVSHIYIYIHPNDSDGHLGRVHGGTQGVIVLDPEPVNGYVKIGAWQHEDGGYEEGYVKEKFLKMVAPDEQYGILINKTEQTMTVYEYGVPLGTFPITTGMMERAATFQETPAGAFITCERINGFASGGFRYEYPIRYDGGNLLHQMGYKNRSGKQDFSIQSAQMGTKASHACVRLPKDGELNAWFLWTHLKRNTKILILDDQENREREYYAIYPSPTPVPTLAPQPTPAPLAQNEQEIVVTVAGDCVLGGRESFYTNKKNYNKSLFFFVDRYGMEYPFSKLQEIFQNDDLTHVNLECVLKDDAKSIDKDKLYKFRGPTSYTGILTAAGIDSVNIANNHYIDFKEPGRASTRAALDAAGVPYSGYEYLYVYEQDGRKIGFGGIRETTYKQDAQIMATDIQKLKDMGCDVIVYSCHFGVEYDATHNELQTKIAREAIDHGADILVGHHAHVVQGIEQYSGGVILYGLGNCMFAGTLDLTVQDGLIAQLRLRFAEDGYQGVQLDLIPIRITGFDHKNDFCPYPSSGEQKNITLYKVQQDSDMPISESMYFPAK